VTGLRGARAAADAILSGRNYLKDLMSLQQELSLHLLIRSVLNRFHSADYDRLLGLLNDEMIEVLAHYNRDHAAKIGWRLLLAQPRFFGLTGIVACRLWAGSFNPVKPALMLVEDAELGQ
jgi:hypothetical protein